MSKKKEDKKRHICIFLFLLVTPQEPDDRHDDVVRPKAERKKLSDEDHDRAEEILFLCANSASEEDNVTTGDNCEDDAIDSAESHKLVNNSIKPISFDLQKVKHNF